MNCSTQIITGIPKDRLRLSLIMIQYAALFCCRLEHAVYNLSRLRESATERYKGFHIPVNWMLDAGYVSHVKSQFSQVLRCVDEYS